MPVASFYVYALCDPDSGLIRYVGMTANPRRRLHGHLNGKCGPRVARWIASLAEKSRVPSMAILFEADNRDAAWNRERELIQRLGLLLGDRLLNTHGRVNPFLNYTMDRLQMMCAMLGRIIRSRSCRITQAYVDPWNTNVRKNGQAAIQLDFSFESGVSL